MVHDIKFADIKVGDTASISKTITEHDVNAFAEVTGDFNPVHVNADFAKNTIFKERVAHGMLSASFISALLGTTLPGANSIYLSQELAFKTPAKIGDTVTVSVEVIKKLETHSQLVLKTTVTNQNGDVVITGKAIVMKKD